MPPPIPADQAFIGDRRGRRRYEQGQIQGLDRTQPILPLRQGILEQQTVRTRRNERHAPRLHPPRHHRPVRCARGRHREGHRRLVVA